MPICAIKVCRNYQGRLKTNKNVKYHRLPSDPILRTRWIEIIRKSRGEDVWQPLKTTVICSEHFRAKDLYFVNTQKRRRLKKEAIPRKAVFLTSLETDDDDDETEDLLEETEKISECVTNVVGNPAVFLTSLETDDDDDETEDLLEETEKISECVTNVVGNPKSLGSNEDVSFGAMETSDSISSNIKVIVSGSTSSCLPGQATGSKIGNEQKKGNDIEDFSDLDSIFDSPKKLKMRQDLRRRIKLQKKHTLEIQSLKRKNQRLKKKFHLLDELLEYLRKRDIIIDRDTLNILSNNVFAADLYSSMKKKLKGSKRLVKKYAPEFRKFCLILHFLSPKAYL